MFRKVLAALLMVALLAVPAYAIKTINADGALTDPNKNNLDFTLSIESAIDDTCKYGTTTDAVPDTLDWPRNALLFAPSAAPVNLHVEWFVESTVTYGYVQFKERAIDSDTYTWGDVYKTWIGATIGDPEAKAYFKVGLWESVRVWAQGSGDGLLSITVYSNVLE